MAQIRSSLTEARTPFANMSWTPDIPASALAEQEYNAGENVESDLRSIRSVLGDEEILDQLTGTPIFCTGGYRNNNLFWIIVATLEGRWYGVTTSGITNLTPGYNAVTNPNAALTGYTADMAITASWSGTTLIINDSVNAPMWLTATASLFQFWSQNGQAITVTGASGTGTAATLTFAAQAIAPYTTGETITVSGMDPAGYNGTHVVAAATTTSVTFASAETGVFVSAGVVQAQYVWNYNPDWSRLRAGWMRLYSSPNVGSILIAGNLTADVISTGSTQNFPVTVRWSQAFGENAVPVDWTPTLTNIANELEVPARGTVTDGYTQGSNFYVGSYWDTVAFTPISYQSSTAPILGVRLYNAGRGLLNENCWAAADGAVYGLDSRDFWVFAGGQYRGLGNQRVRNYFFANLNQEYWRRVFMINNTEHSQIEIYYPNGDSQGWCNQMISYRYDLDIWNPPRTVSEASHATESPIWQTQFDSAMGFDPATRCVVYSRGVANTRLVRKDVGTSFLGNTVISTEFRRDNISLGLPYSQQSLVHRVLPAITGTGNITVSLGGALSVGQTPTFEASVTMPIDTDQPWAQINQNQYRVNSVVFSSNSNEHSWAMTAMTWQFTPVEDSR